MKYLVVFFRYFFVYFVLSVATYLMLRMILDYATFRSDVDFLAFKQDYIHIPLWKSAFYVHVFSSILALTAAFTQFSDHILKEFRNIHRLVGRIYAYDILLVNFPAGMIMAFYANGGLPTKVAFVLLDCLWFFFTYKGVMAARRKQIVAHKHYMMRSYALTFSAITLRSWKLILSHTTHIDAQHIYMIDAWMGFVPNLLLAELLIRRDSTRKRRLTSVET